MGLILPLPFTVKRKLFMFISESPIVAKLQYGLKVRDKRFRIISLLMIIDYFHLHPNPVY